MSLKQYVTGCVLFGLILTTGSVAFSQEKRDFEIKEIRQSLVDAPTYGAAGDLGGRPATLWRKWLKIEVMFESKPEWAADDIQIKYHVLLTDQGDSKYFTGEITHINVAKGQHYSAMFMQPNSVKRYSNGQSAVVTARLFIKGAMISQKTDSQGKNVATSWWEKYQPILGCLLPPQETPWAPVASERFEAVKPIPR